MGQEETLCNEIDILGERTHFWDGLTADGGCDASMSA